MTMLNTLSNLGGQWPGTAVLASKAAIEAYPTLDAFVIVCVASAALGLGWLAFFSQRVRALQALPIKRWQAS